MSKGDTDLILASGSAIRAALLRGAGVEFRVLTSGVDETAIKEEYRGAADGLAAALATAKAQAVVKKLDGEGAATLILAADQLLVFGDKIYDKPQNMAAARERLETLRGATHQLIGAMVLSDNKGAIIWQHIATQSLTMRDFSNEFLQNYLTQCGEVILSSVGAYQYEGRGAQLFSAVEGEHSGILGLSLLPLLAELRDNGALIK